MGSLNDTFCPSETWHFPPRQRETTIYRAMFRCKMWVWVQIKPPEDPKVHVSTSQGSIMGCLFLTHSRVRFPRFRRIRSKICGDCVFVTCCTGCAICQEPFFGSWGRSWARLCGFRRFRLWSGFWVVTSLVVTEDQKGLPIEGSLEQGATHICCVSLWFRSKPLNPKVLFLAR